MEKLSVIKGPRLEMMEMIVTEEKDSLSKHTDSLGNEIEKPSSPHLIANNNNEKFLEVSPNLKGTSILNMGTQELKLFSGTLENYRKGSKYEKRNEEIDLTKKHKNLKEINSQNSLNLLNVFKRAKGVAKKIKKNLYYKNYLNMSNYQRDILKDKTMFSTFSLNTRIFKTIVFFFFFLMF